VDELAARGFDGLCVDEAGVLNVVQKVEYFEADAWADLLF
jgi:hypothetical protein